MQQTLSKACKIPGCCVWLRVGDQREAEVPKFDTNRNSCVCLFLSRRVWWRAITFEELHQMLHDFSSVFRLRETENTKWIHLLRQSPNRLQRNVFEQFPAKKSDYGFKLRSTMPSCQHLPLRPCLPMKKFSPDWANRTLRGVYDLHVIVLDILSERGFSNEEVP